MIAAAEERTKEYLPRLISLLNEDGAYKSTDVTLKPAVENGAVDKYVGKVRDRYDDGKIVVLITTDRLSAFDRALTCIPFKGAVLNGTSCWWFEKTAHIVNNHVIKNEKLSKLCPNVTLGKKCVPFPIEFVMRGYMTGSSGTAIWTHYNKGVRKYCGHDLPEGLIKNVKLPTGNLLTPTTKSDEHDELISAEELVAQGMMTQEDWDFCAEKAHALFAFGQEEALKKGFILVDTKYEFGKDAVTGEILLIDEIHTPDSSRYWIADTYEEAMSETGSKVPGNIDKEFVRLWYKERCDPYKDEVMPTPPNELLGELARRYLMLYELITGETYVFPEGAMNGMGTDATNQLIQKILEEENLA